MMSVQRNQYLMYGIKAPFVKGDEFYTKHERFMDDSAFTAEARHEDGIFCLSDGMSGKYMIVGRVLEKSNNGECIADGEPIEFPELTDLERELIETSVKRNFGLEGDFGIWFVTHYR